MTLRDIQIKLSEKVKIKKFRHYDEWAIITDKGTLTLYYKDGAYKGMAIDGKEPEVNELKKLLN